MNVPLHLNSKPVTSVVRPAAAEATPVQGAPGVADARPGGRVGVHGMVVFGNPQSGLYMSHIPMFHSPHDVQALFKVKFPSSTAFTDGLYTFEPEKFSLDDLLLGRLGQMKGTVYRGDFEDNGQPLQQVKVSVERVLTSAELKNDTPPQSRLEYMVVGSPQDAYLVHRITAPPSFDQIVRLDLSNSTLSAADIRAGASVVVDRPDQVEQRLQPGTVTARIGNRTVRLAVGQVLSTLVGPMFTDGPH